MRRRLLLFAVVLAVVAAAPAGAAPKPAQSWALPEIKIVVAHGLMGASDPAAFRADDPLTRGTLESLVAALAPPTDEAVTAPAVASAAAPVTMSSLDARLVRTLGLTDAATTFAQNARAAGLTFPSRFGSEAVARLLGLRTNHPAARDDLELLPNDPATRAEAAFSAARILQFQGWEVDSARAAAGSFALPALGAWQRRILSRAFSFIGYPYVWGGTSEFPEAPFGVAARGGFDCSGFVWRVYKLQPFPGGGALASTLRGRTTFAMSGEVPPSARIPFAQLQPADVVFFGAHGPRSKPAEVNHMGIYVGNGWMIHSSGYGVALAQLQGWYRDRFAWARRPLAEAGLADPTSKG